MGLILRTDFDPMIDQTDLNLIINSDEHILNEAIASSTNEMIAYLGGRFDTDLIFYNVLPWTATTTFQLGDIVLLFAETWKNQSYTAGKIASDPVSLTVYICILTTTNQPLTNATYWTPIGKQNQLYKTKIQSTGFFPNNATYFDAMDARDPLIVRQLCDLVLYEIHSRINPRNIPEHRIQRRDDAIKFLKNCADPRLNFAVNLPIKDHGENKGFDISFGTSTNISNHTY